MIIILKIIPTRGGSRAAATSKMEHFVIILNGWKLLTITKRSILDVAAALDPLLPTCHRGMSCKSFSYTVYEVLSSEKKSSLSVA